jgi:hypothetical protein
LLYKKQHANAAGTRQGLTHLSFHYSLASPSMVMVVVVMVMMMMMMLLRVVLLQLSVLNSQLPQHLLLLRRHTLRHFTTHLRTQIKDVSAVNRSWILLQIFLLIQFINLFISLIICSFLSLFITSSVTFF